MKIIGLTGSIAMGKTTVLKIFQGHRGCAVFDSDDVVHALYCDTKAQEFQKIKKVFPKAYDPKKKEINRKTLSQIIQKNPRERETLEKIVHPYVRKKQWKFIKRARKEGLKIAVLDIPLLFETNADRRLPFDKIITVFCAPWQQEARFLTREKKKIGAQFDKEKALQRFKFLKSAQMPIQKKLALSDIKIMNATKAKTSRKLRALIKSL